MTKAATTKTQKNAGRRTDTQKLTLKDGAMPPALPGSLAPPAPVFDRGTLTDAELLHLYESILLPRMIEEKMLILLRQGKISKWFSGIGQEAISVGATLALQNQDYIFPLHRNLGVFTCRQMPLAKLFAQWQGKVTGYTKGRDRSFHFGSPQDRVIGMISHLGAMLGVADGVALGGLLRQAETGAEPLVALAFSGDGGASEGDFHEAINTAAVWDLPVIFLIESNGYGLSTPSREQFRAQRLSDRALGYGIEGYNVDGNNLIDVYTAVQRLAQDIRRNPRPVILECHTFRMRGHEEASGTKYVPQELMDAWAERDPVVRYEEYLRSLGLLTDAHDEALRARHKAAIDEGLRLAFADPEPTPDPAAELADVYVPDVPALPPAANAPTHELRLVDAVSEGLRQAMHRHPNLVLMGQDIAEYGGVFKITQGFVEEFGKGRVRNTPLCESAIIATGFGLSLEGYKSMVEMQFADFVSCGFNQIVNNLAKNHYRWGHAPDVVVRMPTGAGVGAGPFHSQSNEAWFTHTPGLRVVYPATPADAKGLLTASLAYPGPVIFFEHKALYRSLQGHVPVDYYTLPMGQARVARAGTDATVVAYGAAVHWAVAAAEALANEGDIEVIDLRTLVPWDKAAVLASVRKTGKVLVAHEDTFTGGFGAELAATIAEQAFRHLDAPVMRVASLDMPVPFNPILEKVFLPAQRIHDKLRELLTY